MINQNGLTIYTDGAARGNPGRGGFGTILIWKGVAKELSGGFRLTTNNRMEIMSVIAGLEALNKKGLNITIYSDSQYVVRSVSEGWLENWIKTDFKGRQEKYRSLETLL
jgi:ribonuclease HI